MAVAAMYAHRRCRWALCARLQAAAPRVRCFSATASASGWEVFNQPRGGNEMCRAGGPNTFMRLPSADLYDDPAACSGLDVAVVGIPLDTGTSFRTGCRAPPQQRYLPTSYCVVAVCSR